MYTRHTSAGQHTLTIETGKLATQAHGAVEVRCGDSVVLATAARSARAREGMAFLPLTVDYREYRYASGRIPGGFFKREGQPTVKEVLTSRMIDRPLRPLFPATWRHETQIIALVLSADPEHDTDGLAITGASAALALSDIPFSRTIAGVRVGLIDGSYVVNPTRSQRSQSRLDAVVAGTADGLVMIEAGAHEVSEEQVAEALDAAHAAIKPIVAAIDDLARHAGKPPLPVTDVESDDHLSRLLDEVRPALMDAMRVSGAAENTRRVGEVFEQFLSSTGQDDPVRRLIAKQLFEAMQERVLREEIFEHGRRLDGRTPDDVRPIWSEAGVLPRTHGSAVFTRGETQALVTCTLGTGRDAQRVESVEGESWKRFLLHYNFPPFSVGEVSFLRGPGRREIGHGALAERALAPVVPGNDTFPYTIRIVSDILEANGSSSMASVCGATLALLDAGVPLKAPVAGIAMGLVLDERTGKVEVLSDIAGAEDHYGDMDFKVAGTAAGVTALQMDVKVSGVATAIMRQALDQARRGRLHILDRMSETLAAARVEMSPFAPRILTMQVPVAKIRDIIGPGGKMIRSIVERSGATIDVEDDGRVNIASADEAAAQKAMAIIHELIATAELHKTYLGTIQRITDFGAFVEIMPGVDGLLHVSEISAHRVQDVRDELAEGQEVLVKVLAIDPTGKIRLSRKALLTAAPENVTPEESATAGPQT